MGPQHQLFRGDTGMSAYNIWVGIRLKKTSFMRSVYDFKITPGRSLQNPIRVRILLSKINILNYMTSPTAQIEPGLVPFS